MRDHINELSGADEYIEHTLAEWGVVGAAVAIVRDGGVAYSRGYGSRQLKRKERVDADTLFPVGSITKSLTAAALGILVDEGQVRWEDLVVDRLPGFQLEDPWITRHLNVRDIIVHRSGIVGGLYYGFAIMDAEEAIEHLRRASSLGAFRDCYCYSNLMYALAGKLIEVVSGISWRQFMRERLLEPLEMRRSGTSPYEFWDSRYVAPTFYGSAPAGACSLEQACDANLAMPHAWNEDEGAPVVLAWQSYDNSAPAGALIASARDMANWLVLNLNEGRFKERQILKPETVRELHALQNPRPEATLLPAFVEAEGYSMGWFRGRFRGRLHLWHGGGMLGFPAYVAFMPEARLGVVVLANSCRRSTCDRLAFHKAIGCWLFDQLLGHAEKDWSEECLRLQRRSLDAAERQEAELQSGRQQNAPPSVALDEYAGIYMDRVGGSGPVTVSVEDGQLRLRFRGEGAFSARLQHWHHDLFRLHSSPAFNRAFDVWDIQRRFVGFSLDPKGNIDSMSVLGMRFPRERP